jgi:hypothetical protein
MSSFACVVRTNRRLPVSPSLAPALLLLPWTSESEAGAPGFVEEEHSRPVLSLIVPRRRLRHPGGDARSTPEATAGLRRREFARRAAEGDLGFSPAGARRPERPPRPRARRGWRRSIERPGAPRPSSCGVPRRAVLADGPSGPLGVGPGKRGDCRYEHRGRDQNAQRHREAHPARALVGCQHVRPEGAREHEAGGGDGRRHVPDGLGDGLAGRLAGEHLLARPGGHEDVVVRPQCGGEQ